MKVMLYVWLESMPGPFVRIVDVDDYTLLMGKDLAELAVKQLLFYDKPWPKYITRIDAEVVEKNAHIQGCYPCPCNGAITCGCPCHDGMPVAYHTLGET